MINIKSQREIELMKEAGKILAETHEKIKDFIKPGISTLEVDDFAKSIVEKNGATCSFYHLYDFPRNFCISLNDEVIHGIPKKDRIIKDGDLVKVDGGVCYKGYQSDAARTHIVGKTTKENEDLVNHTREAFFEALKACVVDNHIKDIGIAITNYISKFGYGIVEDYVGHGIGSDVHEDPDVPNFIQDRLGPKLRPNMTLAIEPMINLGTYEVYTDKDEWTVKTKDGRNSAHYENTILITESEPIILSLI